MVIVGKIIQESGLRSERGIFNHRGDIIPQK